MSLQNPILLDDYSQESAFAKSALASVFALQDIITVTTAESLLEKLAQDHNYGVCIICCKDYLQGLTLVLNRLKSNRDLSLLPILLISGKENVDSVNLLGEFPCTAWMTRPASLLQISKSLTVLSQEVQWYREHLTLIEEQVKQVKDGEEKLPHILNKAPQGGIALGFIYYEIALALQKPKLAEGALRWILQKDDKNLRAIASLGRTLFILNRRSEAQAYLRIARRHSKANVERLCMLGEIAMGEGKLKAAKKVLKEAKKIDPEEIRVRAALDVVSQFEKSIAQKAGDGLALSLVQMYNIIAISHVQDKKMGPAIDIYKGALKIAYDPMVKARLQFNLGLCFLKWQKNQDASVWFQESLNSSGGAFKRSRDYLERLQGSNGSQPSTAQIDEGEWTEIEPAISKSPVPKPQVFDESEFLEESL